MYKEEISKIEDLITCIEQNKINAELDHLSSELASAQKKISDPEFYQDPLKLKEVNIKIKKLERTLQPWQDLKAGVQELLDLAMMGAEEQDESLTEELENLYEDYKKKYADLEILQLFTGETDFNDAYLSIQAGAGGTEACDWALMLYRLYTRWASLKKFSV